MLVIATESGIAAALDTYSKNHLSELEDDYLLPDDWKRLRTIQKILLPFSRATLATEGSGSTLDKVLFTMDVLIQCFTEAMVYLLSLFLFFILISYGRKRMHRIQNSFLESNEDGKFSINIISKQETLRTIQLL
jgi:hypothetical protein